MRQIQLSPRIGDHILLAGDASLRAQADIEDVECHGVLWILDALEEHGILPPTDLLRALWRLRRAMPADFFREDKVAAG